MKMKFYKSLLLFSLFPAITLAQQLDEAFLQSLPNDVANDLIERSVQRDSKEKPQYRRPSTFVKKPEPTSDRFGASVFSMMQSTLMPLNEPNFDGTYILDFGDELELQLVGQKSSISKLIIRRDGSVNIAEIGKIYLAGLSLDNASSLIKNKIKESFIGVESYITLTSIRDIQIIMAGNVYNPGPYTLNGNSNVFHALSVAGGPSEKGSFRSIDLIRNNKKIESIDLYQTFIYGKSSFKTRLTSGDIIFINPVENIVSINGGVKRPGEYELLAKEKLSKLLKFSNGLSKYADLKNIKLERILDGVIKQIPVVNLSQFDNIESQDGDNVFVRSFPFRSVEVIGAVINPGQYLMSEGETINDVILKAGGYSVNAYVFGTVYENLSAKEINTMAINALYEDFLDNLLSIANQGQGKEDLSSLIAIASELKGSEPSGRVIANFSDQGQENEPTFIKQGDRIIVPEITNNVFVYGEVSSEGTTRFKKGEDVSYYLNKKGGLNNNADDKAIYLLQPNGESQRVFFNKNVFVKQANKIEIYPGTVIFVPREINNEYASRLKTQAYASILSSLGVSLASISVLKD